MMKRRHWTPDGAHDDWVDALVQALNYLRSDAGFEASITSVKLMCAARYVREGLTVDEIAIRLDLPKDLVQSYVDRMNRARNSSDAEDDPGARWDACAKKLVEAHRACSQISIDPGQYKSYIRGRLLKLTDPTAASLMKTLDQQFKIS